jgi:WD40-like Beta Propeller Repeat
MKRLSVWPVLLATFALLLAVGAPAQAAFPGANGKIAFGKGSQIFTINSDGTGQTLLAQGTYPAWSADGHKLAFINTAGHLAVMNQDGSNQTDLGVGPEPAGCTDCVVQEPTWSPDGTKIAYLNRQGASGQFRFDIYVVSATPGSGDQTRVPMCDDSVCYFPEDPAWSPDGAWIAALTSDRSSCDPCGLWKVRPDGTDLTQVYPGSGFQGGEFWPDWSPDGSRFVFSELVYADGAIGVVGSDGTGYTLIDTPGSCCFDTDPAWSPDGTKIVFAWVDSATPQQRRLFVMNADGTGKTVLTQLGSTDDKSSPTWQPIVNRSPDCSGVSASRAVLTTYNRRLVANSLEGPSDPDGDTVSLALDGITQDEPVEGTGDATTPDAIDDHEGEFRVRAERDPRGDGRVYRVAYTASDGRGGSCSGTAKVSVPRKRHKPAVDSAPPSYDSLAR